jgi:hypothetical protein
MAMNRRYASLAITLVTGCAIAAVVMLGVGGAPLALANNTYFNLAGGNLTQNWSDTTQFTTDNNWNGVPSIIGYDGADAAGVEGSDPCVLTNAPLGAAQVTVNKLHPSTITNVAVVQFVVGTGSEVTSNLVGIRGQTSFDAPSLLIHLNATGRSNINIAFDAVDIDHSGNNALSKVAVQWRAGASGNWTNAACVADATEGPNLKGKVTPVNVTLPAGANNQAQLQVRIMTYNGAGNVGQGITSADEWIGIDNLVVSSGGAALPTPTHTQPGPTPTNTQPGPTPTATRTQPPPTPNPNLTIKNYLPIVVR